MKIREVGSKTKNFLKETRAETKKVTWPSRRYILVATLIILVIVFVVGFFVMGIDYVFARVFRYLMDTFAGKGI